MKKPIILLGVLFLMAMGCAARQKPLYYWGDYSSSLYKFKKAPTEENEQNHKTVLLKVIATSEENNARVPPGVCCEYGYLLLREGKTKEAMQYFDMELKNYPESKVFIDRIKAKWGPEKEEKR